ncbi:MAG: hypothetical protein H7Y04_03200 [Verrucomicrobia bacterium]|nr:hypothetical protein [Cytophagales bacterium]
MGAIIRFIILSLLFTFLIRSLFKAFRWFFGAETLKRGSENLKKQYHEGYKREGDLHINQIPVSKRKPAISDQDGEYVPYEEVK